MNNRSRVSCLFLLAVFFSGFLSNPIRADDFDLSGMSGLINSDPIPVNNPVFVNLYPDADWDAEVQPAFKRKVIDDYTAALIDSDYFNSSSQYDTGTIVFSGSVISSCQLTGLPNPADQDLMDYVSCNFRNGTIQTVPNHNLVVNVLLPPSVVPRRFIHISSVAFNFLLDVKPCDGFSAYHSAASPVSGLMGIEPFTVIPTSAACHNDTLGALTESLAHEMIEAITEPVFPFGWVHHTGDFRADSDEGEAADVCQTGAKANSPSAFAFLAPGSNFTPRLPLGSPSPNNLSFPTAAFYWSNSDQSCAPVFAFDPASSPTIQSADASVGSESGGMTWDLTIKGAHFGSLPSGFVSRSSIPYFEWRNSTQASGNSILNGGESGDWTFATWSDSLIVAKTTMFSFHGHSCDPSTLTVMNPQNGKAGSFAFVITGPTRLLASSLPAIAYADSIYARDFNRTTIEGVDVNGHDVAGPLAITISVSNPQGSVGINTQTLNGQPVFAQVPSRYAGAYLLSATTTACDGSVVSSPDLPFVLAPSLMSPQPDHGRSLGGTRVSINGSGFVSGATDVFFGRRAASNVRVVSDKQLVATTPAGSGVVRVVVKSNGVRSDRVSPSVALAEDGMTGLPPTFTYFTPDVPVLTSTAGCGGFVVNATVFGANGAPIRNRDLDWSVSSPGSLAYPTTTTDASGASTNFVQPANPPRTLEVRVNLKGSVRSAAAQLYASSGGCQMANPPSNQPNFGNQNSCPACGPVDVADKFKIELGVLIEFGAVQLDTGRRFNPERVATEPEFSRGLDVLLGRISALSAPLATPAKPATPLTYANAAQILKSKLHVGAEAEKQLLARDDFDGTTATLKSDVSLRRAGELTRLDMANVLYRVKALIYGHRSSK